MSGMYREVPMFFCSFHELIDKSKLDKVFRYRNRWKIELKKAGMSDSEAHTESRRLALRPGHPACLVHGTKTCEAQRLGIGSRRYRTEKQRERRTTERKL